MGQLQNEVKVGQDRVGVLKSWVSKQKLEKLVYDRSGCEEIQVEDLRLCGLQIAFNLRLDHTKHGNHRLLSLSHQLSRDSGCHLK